MISVQFLGKPFNIRVIQVYAPYTNTEEAEVEWFYEDLQELNLLELKPKKDILFVIGDWNAKVGSQKKLKESESESEVTQLCLTLLLTMRDTPFLLSDSCPQ